MVCFGGSEPAGRGERDEKVVADPMGEKLITGLVAVVRDRWFCRHSESRGIHLKAANLIDDSHERSSSSTERLSLAMSCSRGFFVAPDGLSASRTNRSRSLSTRCRPYAKGVRACARGVQWVPITELGDKIGAAWGKR